MYYIYFVYTLPGVRMLPGRGAAITVILHFNCVQSNLMQWTNLGAWSTPQSDFYSIVIRSAWPLPCPR